MINPENPVNQIFTDTRTCPVSGLSIISRPDWIYKGHAHDFKVVVHIVGEAILLTSVSGYLDIEDQKNSIALQDRVAREFFKNRASFIQIQEWHHFKGASNEARQYYIDYLAGNPKIMGVIFCNVSLSFKISINLGKRLNMVPFPVHIAKDYERAVLLAVDILSGTRSSKPSEVPESVEFHRLKSGRKNLPGFFLPKQKQKIDQILNEYQEELLGYLSDVNWEEKGLLSFEIHQDHPFKELMNAISVIKGDLDQLLEQREAVQRALTRKEEESRALLEKTVATRTAELEDEIRKKNHAQKINAILFRISNAVNTTANVDELFASIHDILNDLIELPNFIIGIYHPSEDRVSFPYFMDEHDSGITEIQNISKTLSLTGEVILGRKTLFLTREMLVERSSNRAVVGTLPEIWMGVPLMVQDHIIGLMATQSYTDPDYFTATDLEILMSVSNQVAVAIERKKAQEELVKAKEEAEDAFRSTETIISSLQAGVMLIDAETHVIDRINQAGAQMLGSSVTDIVGRTCHGFLCPREKENCPVTDQGISVDNAERVMLNREMGEIPILKTVSRIFLKGRTYLLESFVDISVQKKAEQDLINETARANSMAMAARAASKAKSEFLANMSHEIRTPINGVIGMAELLMDTRPTDQQRQLIQTIGSEADSLLRIINDVLDFSKVEAGKMGLEHIDFDLRTTFEDLCAVLAIRAEKKGLEFLSYLDPSVPTLVKGDPGRLRQVFMNLAGNALKFTHEGEIFMKGEMIENSPETVTIKFSVTDSGIGIPEDKLDSIFDSFSQADGSTTRKYGGTGLGTTISRQIVGLMKGAIGVDSTPGKGSTFWFVIPFEKQPEPAEVKEAHPVDFKGLQVLVVDDNAVNRHILEQYLEYYGSIPVSAKSGGEALQKLEKSVPGKDIHLIITDFQMPRMDGMTLAEQIRRIRAWDTVPVIILTSMAGSGDGELCKAAGIRGYLSKPVKRDELKDTIAMVMGLTGEKSGDLLVTRHRLAEKKQQHLQILLAEDYPTNQQIAVRHLERAGYAVTLAEDGQKAVHLFKRKKFDLVLMDIQMPQLDGYEATASIRQFEETLEKQGRPFPRTPVIAMTAHAMKGYREKCLEAGMDDYLSKPLKRDELLAMVNKWTPRRKDPEKQQQISSRGHQSPDISERPENQALPLDRQRALEEFDGDFEFFRTLVEEFLENTGRMIPDMDRLIENQAVEPLRKMAHAIKGGAANLTADALSKAASDIEALRESEGISAGEFLMTILKQEYDRLRAYAEQQILAP
jgi:signal transduction histidine kinase/CheY-like chemotaxis protein/HPt (histidine-containing phosphotransfer) domain-containing protein